MILQPITRPIIRPLERAITEGGGGLGPEIVVNGTFDSGLTAWATANTAPATVSVVGGQAVWDTSGGGTGRIRQTLPTIAGQTYVLTCSITGAMTSYSIGTTAGTSDVLGFTGAARSTFVAASATSFLQVVSTSNGATADNISVRLM